MNYADSMMIFSVNFSKLKGHKVLHIFGCFIHWRPFVYAIKIIYADKGLLEIRTAVGTAYSSDVCVIIT